jgi:hypothetical protein
MKYKLLHGVLHWNIRFRVNSVGLCSKKGFICDFRFHRLKLSGIVENDKKTPVAIFFNTITAAILES